MMRVLVPIMDGSEVECAARNVIERYRGQRVVLYVVNVQLPIPRFVTRFVSRRQLDEFHRENGMEILRPLVEQLDAAGIAHQEKILVGLKAETIAEFARDHHCDQILVARHKGMLETLGLGSICGQLRHLLGANGRCMISEVY